VSGNLKKSWELFHQVWDAYEIITGLDNQDDKTRVAHFIIAIGPDALEIHNGLPFKSEEEKQTMGVIFELWENHCVGKIIVIYERYTFNNCVQTSSFDEYYVTLRKLVATCSFGALTDELIRDRIVCGIRDESVRQKLLEEANLTLERCIDCCKAAEATQKHMKDMSKDAQHTIHAMSGRGRKKCGCPAYGQTCSLCQGKNHFARKCKQYKAHEVDRGNYSETYTSSEECSLVVELEQSSKTYTTNEVNALSNGYERKILVVMQLRGSSPSAYTSRVMQVDCGATCNVIPEKYFPYDCTITSVTNMRLSMYNKEYVNVLGIAKLHVINPKNDKKYLVHFAVVKGQSSMLPLIGSHTAQQMGLIKIRKFSMRT
jgi:hypothetical protein